MSDEYDPNDCELGVCDHESCLHGEDSKDHEGPRGEFIELEDQIPEIGVKPPKPEKTPIGTIDLTPSWVAVVRIYLEVIADPDAREQAQKDAREEILRCAALADLYVKEHKGGSHQEAEGGKAAASR